MFAAIERTVCSKQITTAGSALTALATLYASAVKGAGLPPPSDQEAETLQDLLVSARTALLRIEVWANGFEPTTVKAETR